MTASRLGTVAAVAVVAVLAAVGIAAAAEDPYRPQQWALDRIGAPQAWAVAQGAGQVVAVIDSGVDLQHPDLVDRFLRDGQGRIVGRDLVESDDQPQDLLGHGTMVAGIVAATADNGFGVAGVAPQAQLMPVRVLDEHGDGFADDVDRGIRWAVDHGATVVNLSLEADDVDAGGAGSLSAPVEAVRYAWERGVIVVAAAGNSGSSFTDYPADSPVVLVGATGRDDGRAPFSDAGDDLVMAPGVDIVSTWCVAGGSDRCDPQSHTFGIADGTSFAAPHVSGALAVLRSAGLDHREAVERLHATARDLGPAGRDDETGYGLVDLAAATVASQPSPSPTSPTATPTPHPTPTSAGTSGPAPPPASSPEPAATSTEPSPSPSVDEPNATPTPTAPSPSPSASPTTTAPNPDAREASAVGDGDDEGRGPWPALAVLLVLATAAVALRVRFAGR